ncbi:hypothetical protein PIB30_044733 [Stylosanthes scabra]|uniref:Uncharacterized protein n=1 Tax=Stylosanthes scabra TaxID=79078 RepID=A0ABU6XED4_9FABA|nr:hypothetical protein [Stylosanthes scabra]
MDCNEKSKNMMNSSAYFSYPYCSSFSLYNNALRPEGEKGNYNSLITPICDEPYYEHSSCYAKSDTDSCSEGGVNDAAAVEDEDEEEEVSLDELLLDGKAKKKIEQLAAMVGVKTTEPVVVLTEVVRVLKLMKRINYVLN